MARGKKEKILACPPREFHWVNDIDDLETLSVIYAKLDAITNTFSYFRQPSAKRPVMASEIYGYWFIFRDICAALGDILKVDRWTGEIGKKKEEEMEASQ